MPTGAFIQDEMASSSSSSNLMRVNLLSAQPLGAASLQTSSLQVFLDRRLDQDDNRGMEQAMNDNIVTSNKFLILFESLNNAPGKDTTNSNVNKVSDMPSLTSQLYSYDLLNPLVKLITSNRNIKDSVELLSGKQVFPCDLRFINMRTMQKEVKTGNEGEDVPMSN
jgi:alpha-mannosidase II